MKSLFFIFIFFSIRANAQVRLKANSDSIILSRIPGLARVYPIDSTQTTEVFRWGRGFEGILLTLISNGIYKTQLFSCDGKQPLDSGLWKVSNNQLVVGNRTYELYQFQSLSYLVDITEKRKFLTQFLNSYREAKKDTDTKISFAGKVLWGIPDEYFSK